jgi:hypothetical protein
MFSRCFARELSSAVRKRGTAGKSNLTLDDKTGIAFSASAETAKSFRGASARRKQSKRKPGGSNSARVSEAGQAL